MNPYHCIEHGGVFSVACRDCPAITTEVHMRCTRGRDHMGVQDAADLKLRAGRSLPVAHKLRFTEHLFDHPISAILANDRVPLGFDAFLDRRSQISNAVCRLQDADNLRENIANVGTNPARASLPGPTSLVQPKFA